MKIKHISNSRASLFEECQLKYKYKYHDEIPSPVEEPIYFLYGKVIHKIAEEFVLAKKTKSISEITQKVLDGSISLEREENQTKTSIKLPAAYIGRLSSDVKNILYITEKIGFEGEVEWPFTYDLEPPNNKVIVGFIDRLAKIGDKYLILDYKTTKPGNWRKNATNIKKDLQLNIYARIVQKQLNIPPEKISACLFYVLDGHTVGIPYFEEKNLELTEKYFLDSYNKIVNVNPELASPNVGLHCKRCDYKSHCPFFRNSVFNN